jgi:hypothetical protein
MRLLSVALSAIALGWASDVLACTSIASMTTWQRLAVVKNSSPRGQAVS